MTKYKTLCELTPDGMNLFREVMYGKCSEAALDLTNDAHCKPIANSAALTIEKFNTRKEMATAVLASLNEISVEDMVHNTGLWAWLTFVMRDLLFKRKSGKLQVGEVHKWFPSAPDDYHKAQRHKVRMPVLLLARFGDTVDHLLCGKPDTPGEVAEQLTAQQEMFTSKFQSIAKRLYYDVVSGKNRPGSAGKSGGSARRLRTIRRQFNHTWELEYFEPHKFLHMLPNEFDKYKVTTNI